MSREEAIKCTVSAFHTVCSERCCSAVEREDTRREAADVLRAFGVPEEEVDVVLDVYVW